MPIILRGAQGEKTDLYEPRTQSDAQSLEISSMKVFLQHVVSEQHAMRQQVHDQARRSLLVFGAGTFLGCGLTLLAMLVMR